MKSTPHNIARRASFDEVRPAQGANLDQELPGAVERQCKRGLIAVADLNRRGISEATAYLARYFKQVGRHPAPQAVRRYYFIKGIFGSQRPCKGLRSGRTSGPLKATTRAKLARKPPLLPTKPLLMRNQRGAGLASALAPSGHSF